MSIMGLQEVEKIERFYLSSCTDLTLKDSLHQSFPALNVGVDKNQSCVTFSRISRSQSGRAFNSTTLESEAALQTNNRAKLAFFKICDSLATGLGRSKTETDPEPEETFPSTSETLASPLTGSCHLITMPSMSKAEFIKKLEEGMLKNPTESQNMVLSRPENPAEPEPLNSEFNEYIHAKSDSVLVKSMTSKDNGEVTSTQNTSKSATAIADETDSKPLDNARPRRSSAASKMIVTGILLLVFFGIIKNASSR